MQDKNTQSLDRRQLISSLLLGGLYMPMQAYAKTESSSNISSADFKHQNPLLWAVAWSATAAEYGALCYQAFNLATLRVEQALRRNNIGSKPLAVITDVDNTIVHAASYWGYLINNGMDFFDDAAWDRWIPKNLITPVPGAREFLDYCRDNNVEVFYVTNRDQGENTEEYALKQLRYLQLPFADNEHLTVYRNTSNKTPAKKAISESHELILMLGDNLNDYKRDYYVDGIDARYALMERDRYDFGDKFILLPNATDGHWVRAIFGDSEPAPTDSNRAILKAAAARDAWDGR
ncbi:hypothetical protein N2382_06170 [SAR92 clade bacterium H921]|nr:hypothetical protein [SAR92 clade bacterium H921]